MNGQMMKMKHKVFCSTITGRSMVSVFSHLLSHIPVSRCVTRKNWFNFGEDPNPDLTIFWVIIIHHWELWLNRYTARYVKKLWMDSDKTWWTGWVCNKDKLIRFWWRYKSGSGYQNYLITSATEGEGGYVFTTVCLSVCLCLCRISQ